MKKLLTVLLSILMVFALVGCNSTKDTPIVQEPEKQEEIVEETKEEPEIVGGFVDVEDGTLTDELKEIFNSALEGLMGASYEPVELVATQVVNGINYKFLAKGTKTTNPITKGSYYITIYKDLQGNVELKDIEVIEEKQEEVVEVDKSMNYWVVFYNPDGNELQRTAQKLGTTPKYEGEEPCYWDKDYWYRFVSWTDKQGNEIEEFTPINGNTYIYAKYEIGGENKFEEEVEEIIPIPIPAPTPTPTPPTMYTVTFELDKDLGVPLGEVHNASGDKVTSIPVSSGTIFSTEGNVITIGGDVFTVVANSGYTFHSFNPTSGTITSAITIKVNISQNQP